MSWPVVTLVWPRLSKTNDPKADLWYTVESSPSMNRSVTLTALIAAVLEVHLHLHVLILWGTCQLMCIFVKGDSVVVMRTKSLGRHGLEKVFRPFSSVSLREVGGGGGVNSAFWSQSVIERPPVCGETPRDWSAINHRSLHCPAVLHVTESRLVSGRSYWKRQAWKVFWTHT